MNREQLKKILFVFLLATCHLSLATMIHAEVLERIVAIVNDDVILLSEFEETFQIKKKSTKEATKDEILNEMINRLLLLQQAKRFRLGNAAYQGTLDDNEIVDDYREKRIKALIHIPFVEIRSYYSSQKEQFGTRDFYEVIDEIEDYLIEEKLKDKLSKHLSELRKKAYIRIQLEE